MSDEDIRRYESVERARCACPDRNLGRVRAVSCGDGTTMAYRHGAGTDCASDGRRDGAPSFAGRSFGTLAEAEAWCRAAVAAGDPLRLWSKA